MWEGLRVYLLGANRSKVVGSGCYRGCLCSYQPFGLPPLKFSLPMGFSWATYFAQSVSCKLLRESLPPLCSQLLTDRSNQKGPPCQDNTAVHYAYSDILGILGCSRVWRKQPRVQEVALRVGGSSYMSWICAVTWLQHCKGILISPMSLLKTLPSSLVDSINLSVAP